MKKVFLLVGLALGLVACGSNDSTPKGSVSGNWSGSLSNSATSLPITASFSQTNSPTAGDFNGKVYLPSISSTGYAIASGNVNSGVFNAVDNSGTMNCTGKFTSFVRYTGTCSLPTDSGTRVSVGIDLKKQ